MSLEDDEKIKDAESQPRKTNPVNTSEVQAKKKWPKRNVQDKLKTLFDKATYGELWKEVPHSQLTTAAVVSERLEIRGPLAGAALRELLSKGQVELVQSTELK